MPVDAIAEAADEALETLADDMAAYGNDEIRGQLLLFLVIRDGKNRIRQGDGICLGWQVGQMLSHYDNACLCQPVKHGRSVRIGRHLSCCNENFACRQKLVAGIRSKLAGRGPLHMQHPGLWQLWCCAGEEGLVYGNIDVHRAWNRAPCRKIGHVDKAVGVISVA